MVETNHHGLKAWVALHQVVKRPGAVLASAERNQAVVAITAPIFGNESIQLFQSFRPIDLSLCLLSATHIANSLGVEHQRFVGFGQQTASAALKGVRERSTHDSARPQTWVEDTGILESPCSPFTLLPRRGCRPSPQQLTEFTNTADPSTTASRSVCSCANPRAKSIRRQPRCFANVSKAC